MKGSCEKKRGDKDIERDGRNQREKNEEKVEPIRGDDK